jgi:4-amino-4-deoxy-L-arabinose transferase-like glycosyltransferase
MGLGTGVGLIASGAVLMWALDVDIPHVQDQLLGQVLLVGGIVAVVAASVVRAQQPEASPNAGIALIVAGAALVWAVEADIPHVYDEALGVILLVGGAATVVATMAFGSPRSLRSLRRREVVNRP